MSTAQAKDHYVDPREGSDSGDGSQQDPWRTLQEVIESGKIETQEWGTLPYEEGAVLAPKNAGAPVKAGDRILLASGFHGEVVINGAYNSSAIRVEAQSGALPTLSRLTLRGVKGWVVSGLSISPSHDNSPVQNTETTPVSSVLSHSFHGPSSEVTIDNCDIFTEDDISGWRAEDWVARALKGIDSNADDIVISNNRVRNISFGISTSGLRARVIGNSVRNFSGDGLRGLGDFNVFEYNYVANSYDVDENHDDGFQSWSVGSGGVGTGEVKGIVLRGNLFLNREEANQNLSGPMQGIGCFDGFFVDWVIENNVVIADHFHGITLTGARNSLIVNNTVLDLDDVSIGPPWIRITPHKDGRPSSGNTVRNNLATAIELEGDVINDHNMIIDDPALFFAVPQAPWDLHLLPTAAAIDAGSSESAPTTDRDQLTRPQGSAVDIGAYEWTMDEPSTDGGLSDASSAADATVRDAAGNPDDAGSTNDAGSSDARPGGELTSGCQCRTSGDVPKSNVWWLLLIVGWVRWTRFR